MNPAQQNKVDVSVSIEKSIHGESRFFRFSNTCLY